MNLDNASGLKVQLAVRAQFPISNTTESRSVRLSMYITKLTVWLECLLWVSSGHMHPNLRMSVAPESGRPFLAEVPLPEVPGIFLPQNRPYRSV